MITREQIEAIRAAMVAPINWTIICCLLLVALTPLGKKCKDELRSMAAACREGGLKKFCQYEEAAHVADPNVLTPWHFFKVGVSVGEEGMK